jgi:hypothetical protein
VDWVVSRRVNESCYVGSLTRRGLALVRGVVVPSVFAFEASSYPCVICLSDVVGGGLLADGQTRCN